MCHLDFPLNLEDVSKRYYKIINSFNKKGSFSEKELIHCLEFFQAILIEKIYYGNSLTKGTFNHLQLQIRAKACWDLHIVTCIQDRTCHQYTLLYGLSILCPSVNSTYMAMTVRACLALPYLVNFLYFKPYALLTHCFSKNSTLRCLHICIPTLHFAGTHISNIIFC